MQTKRSAGPQSLPRPLRGLGREGSASARPYIFYDASGRPEATRPPFWTAVLGIGQCRDETLLFEDPVGCRATGEKCSKNRLPLVQASLRVAVRAPFQERYSLIHDSHSWSFSGRGSWQSGHAGVSGSKAPFLQPM